MISFPNWWKEQIFSWHARTFAVSAAVICNSLPTELRQTDVVHLDNLAEVENLHQLNDVSAAHLRTV